MKGLTSVTGIAFLIFLLGTLNSCTVTNDVVSHGLIQKRKYRKGWFIKKPERSLTGHLKVNSNELLTAEENFTNEIEVNTHIVSSSSSANSLASDVLHMPILSRTKIQNNEKLVASVIQTGSQHRIDKIGGAFSDSICEQVPLEIEPDVIPETGKKKLEPMALVSLIIFCTIIGLIISVIIFPNPVVLPIALALCLALIVTSIIALVRIDKSNNSYKGKALMWVFIGFFTLTIAFARYIFYLFVMFL